MGNTKQLIGAGLVLGMLAGAGTLGALGGPAGEAESSPFNAKFTLIVVDPGPPGLTEDSGHVSGLGSFEGESVAIPDEDVPGTGTLTSAWTFSDGDTLIVETVTDDIDPVGDGTFTILGGTGIFAGATGAGTFHAEFVGPGEIKATMKGIITL